MSKQTDLINIPDVITVSGAVVTESASAVTVEHTINNETSSGNRYSMLTFKDQGTNKYYQYQNHNDGNILFRNEHATGSLQFMTGGANERLRIDSSGVVGIGVSDPSTWSLGKALHIGVKENNLWGEADYAFHMNQNAYYNGGWKYTHTDQATRYSQEDGQHIWHYAASGTADATLTWSEAMRIDASGNLLVGKTSGPNYNAVGIDLASTGNIQATRSGGEALVLNRQTNDGDIVHFRKDGTLVGSIGNGSSTSIYIAGNTQANSNLGFGGSSLIYPTIDNVSDVGAGGLRFDDIFATNGTIQTSDFNEKQDIASLTATEMLVGKRISALFKTFRWKDSVAEKGDNARTHTGVIAQDVQAAFTAEGLDAGNYALFISSTWWETQTEVPAVEAVEAVEEVVDEDGNVTTEAVEAVEGKDAYTRTDTYDTEAEAPEGATSKTRMGIRYPELLSFVAAYNEQRFASIEARLTALEA